MCRAMIKCLVKSPREGHFEAGCVGGEEITCFLELPGERNRWLQAYRTRILVPNFLTYLGRDPEPRPVTLFVFAKCDYLSNIFYFI